MGRAAALVLLTLLAGCLSVEFSRTSFHRRPSGADSLRPGETTLETCLDALGAPLVVREQAGGALLAWGWSKERGWGFSLSPPADNDGISFRYQRTLAGLEGLVLWFDADWTLTSIRYGRLAEVLLPEERRAPFVEE